jgi:alpha-ketoglutarate-dependent taurine dioxygenase
MRRTSASVLSCADYGAHPESDGALGSAYAALLERNGYVHLTDVPDGFDHPRFLARFGDFYPGPSGKLIDDVIAEPGMDDVYYGNNRQGLLPHTEGYEFAGLPPRYLALWCVVPPVGLGGETTLLDAYPLLEALPAEERRQLEAETYDWQASEGLRRRGLGQRSTHPILETVDGVSLLRFSCNNILLPEAAEPVRSFLSSTKQLFDAEHVTIKYRRNDLLHFDNWRMLHSRNAFEDAARHLKRVQLRHRGERQTPTCP